jgi:hypothetical protein
VGESQHPGAEVGVRPPQADQLGDQAPKRSAERLAWWSLAACLSTTGSVQAARRALADVGQPEVRDTALQLLGQIASQE